MKNALLNNIGILVLRLGVGALMLPHGWSKINMLVDGNSSQFLDPLGIGKFPSLLLSGGAEFVASVFIMLGLFTRLSSVALAVNMVVAYTVASEASHEGILLYLLAYVTLALLGGGDFSLANVLARKSGKLDKLRDA